MIRTSFQKRTMFEKPNTILEQQRELQGGATPYLRGDADPTYLRRPADKTIASALLGATALGWTFVLYYHSRMWVGAGKA
jgi:hypothetical protein